MACQSGVGGRGERKDLNWTKNLSYEVHYGTNSQPPGGLW